MWAENLWTPIEPRFRFIQYAPGFVYLCVNYIKRMGDVVAGHEHMNTTTRPSKHTTGAHHWILGCMLHDSRPSPAVRTSRMPNESGPLTFPLPFTIGALRFPFTGDGRLGAFCDSGNGLKSRKKGRTFSCNGTECLMVTQNASDQ